MDGVKCFNNVHCCLTLLVMGYVYMFCHFILIEMLSKGDWYLNVKLGHPFFGLKLGQFTFTTKICLKMGCKYLFSRTSCTIYQCNLYLMHLGCSHLTHVKDYNFYIIWFWIIWGKNCGWSIKVLCFTCNFCKLVTFNLIR